jgi:hypothetical protein
MATRVRSLRCPGEEVANRLLHYSADRFTLYPHRPRRNAEIPRPLFLWDNYFCALAEIYFSQGGGFRSFKENTISLWTDFYLLCILHSLWIAIAQAERNDRCQNRKMNRSTLEHQHYDMSCGTQKSRACAHSVSE